MNAAADYAFIPASGAAARVAEGYWELRAPAERETERIAPDGACEAIFHLGESPEEARDGGYSRQPDALFYGPLTRVLTLRRARALHPASSVLATCLGAALARAGPSRSAEAEAALSDAVAADPRNPLARFERAALRAAAGAVEAALADLDALKRVAPREAGVWFQAGRLHARAGRAAEARAHLAAALDLAPAAADAALIKAALDRLGRGGGGGGGGWGSEAESDGGEL
jgi:tetratricopeptide (TPR) repeat protein